MSCSVTAVITTHDRPDHLPIAIRSVLAESFEDFELVVVEDGFALDRNFIESLRPRTRLVQGSGLGIARARNVGLAAANGEYVIYLDDDDVAKPWRMEILYREARRQSADLCFGTTRRTAIDEHRALRDVPTHHRLPGPVTLPDLMMCTPHVNGVLVRADLLRRNGGFEPACDHLDDWAAWLRLADAGVRMWAIDTVVAEWRVHAAGLTANVEGAGLMKTRIGGLCAYLLRTMSPEGVQVVRDALDVLRENDVTSYDDYADAMSRRRCPDDAGDLVLV